MKIESSVPSPDTAGRGRPHKYPWNKMEVGDSFFVPNTMLNVISCAAIGRGKRYNEKYACRTVDDGVRVWRIE